MPQLTSDAVLVSLYHTLDESMNRHQISIGQLKNFSLHPQNGVQSYLHSAHHPVSELDKPFRSSDIYVGAIICIQILHYTPHDV